jgi:hypothetical protein
MELQRGLLMGCVTTRRHAAPCTDSQHVVLAPVTACLATSVRLIHTSSHAITLFRILPHPAAPCYALLHFATPLHTLSRPVILCRGLHWLV